MDKRIERWGYIGEGGLTRYRVKIGTDRVGRAVYREATPEEIQEYLNSKKDSI